MKNILFLLLLININLFAQSEYNDSIHNIDSCVNIDKFDQITFNEALLIEIGKIRGWKHKVKFDSLLYKATKFHGMYVTINENITHSDIFDVNTKYFIPSMPYIDKDNISIGYYNMPHNENEIISKFILKRDLKLTYRELALKSIYSFKNSKAHWGVIIDDLYPKGMGAGFLGIKKNGDNINYYITIRINVVYDFYINNPDSVLNFKEKLIKGEFDKEISKKEYLKDYLFTKNEYELIMKEFKRRDDIITLNALRTLH